MGYIENGKILCGICKKEIGKIELGAIKVKDNHDTCMECGDGVCNKHLTYVGDDFWICDNCKAKEAD